MVSDNKHTTNEYERKWTYLPSPEFLVFLSMEAPCRVMKRNRFYHEIAEYLPLKYRILCSGLWFQSNWHGEHDILVIDVEIKDPELLAVKIDGYSTALTFDERYSMKRINYISSSLLNENIMRRDLIREGFDRPSAACKILSKDSLTDSPFSPFSPFNPG